MSLILVPALDQSVVCKPINSFFFDSQLGRLLVYMLNPCKDLGLACFALHLSNHARASEILTVVLTGSGAGTKVGTFNPRQYC